MKLNAFDSAWDIVKALYHGTGSGDEIEHEGLTDGRESPDLDPNVVAGLSQDADGWDLSHDDIKALFMRDFSENDWERMMVGDDWKYAAGNTEKETANAPAGRMGALAQALAYGGDVFEIDENHPDAPEWIEEPIWQRNPHATEGKAYSRYAWPKETIQWRTKGNVPPQTMRRMSPKEVSDIQNRLSNWRQRFSEREALVEDMMWDMGFLNSLSSPQQAELMRQYKTITGMGQLRATQQEVDDWLRSNYLEQYVSDGKYAE